MNLTLLMSLVVSSELKDWHQISCRDHGRVPSSREHPASGEEHDGNSSGRAHSNVAVYMPDISISLAFGLTWMEGFEEEWATRFPDRKACGCYADVFYNGALVFRDAFVIVDGGRTKLPMPARRDTLGVPSDHARFIRLLDRFEGISSFDRDFERAGLCLTDTPWPVFGLEPGDEDDARQVPRGLIQ